SFVCTTFSPSSFAWTSAFAAMAPASGTSADSGTVIGPNFVHVLPPSPERSIHAFHLPFSTDEPLTIAPSFSTSGLSLIGPRMPSGRCSSALHVLPSSALHFRAPAHVLGFVPYL